MSYADEEEYCNDEMSFDAACTIAARYNKKVTWGGIPITPRVAISHLREQMPGVIILRRKRRIL